MGGQRRERQVAPLLILGLLLPAWPVHLWYRTVRRENLRLLNERTIPYVFAGLELDLADQLEELRLPVEPPAAPQHQGPARQRLVLLFDDNCAACAAEIPRWRRLLEALTWTDDQQLWIVTINTTKKIDPLLREAARRKITSRLFKVRRTTTFAAATGLLATPFACVLDAHDRIRVLTSRLNDETLALFVAVLRSPAA
jgi:hypothetical protein